MSTKNSSLNIPIDLTTVEIKQSYRQGLVKRIGISVAVFLVVHIAARVTAGLITLNTLQDFNIGFMLNGNFSDFWSMVGGLLLIHACGFVFIVVAFVVLILICSPFLGAYIYIRWLFKSN